MSLLSGSWLTRCCIGRMVLMVWVWVRARRVTKSHHQKHAVHWKTQKIEHQKKKSIFSDRNLDPPIGMHLAFQRCSRQFVTRCTFTHLPQAVLPWHRQLHHYDVLGVLRDQKDIWPQGSADNVPREAQLFLQVHWELPVLGRCQDPCWWLRQ